MEEVPTHTRWVVIGAGFAGAATAWALGRMGLGPGVILEQESSYGTHASGRNAGLLRLAERDPAIGILARRSLESIRDFDEKTPEVLRFVGGLTLAPRGCGAELEDDYAVLCRQGLTAKLLSHDDAVTRFPFLAAIRFQAALWCPEEGVVDIHALLTHYLRAARDHSFRLHTGCRVEELLLEGGSVTGVRVGVREIRADAVIDASGAWAGRLGRADEPLPLQPFRRHLFVSDSAEKPWPRDAPFVWMWRNEFYCRPEGAGLLLSPCDETPASPGLPSNDPAAAELLAVTLTGHAPDLARLALRRSWACLRTFAPDRRPVIGPDPALRGLFHVSGLGGFGVTASAAIGELAGLVIAGRETDWIDPADFAPTRPRLEPTGRLGDGSEC